MLPLLAALVPGVFDAIGKLIDRIIPDPAQRDAAKLALMQAEGQQALAELQVSMSAVLAEASSKDPWTSRARPAFLYVIYIMILTSLPMGVLWAISPGSAQGITLGVKDWLAAIPEPMWALFGFGYGGYTIARSYDKKAGTAS